MLNFSYLICHFQDMKFTKKFPKNTQMAEPLNFTKVERMTSSLYKFTIFWVCGLDLREK